MTKILLWFKILWAALSSRSNQVFYDKISSFYDDIYTQHEVHAQKIMTILNDIYAGRKSKTFILDLGCGTGMMTGLLSKDGFKVIGTDISFESLCVHQDHFPEHRLIQADANYLPIADDTLDSVVCLGVWRHFSDIERVLDEVSRVVTTDGTFVVGYFPPAMAGSINLNQKWWGRLLMRFYKHATKALGYVDRADFSLEKETLEIARQKFKKVSKVESADNKYLIFAQDPFKPFKEEHKIETNTQDMDFMELDKILRCPSCVSTDKRTGRLKLSGNNQLICQEPECNRQYTIRKNIPILLTYDGENPIEVPKDNLLDPMSKT